MKANILGVPWHNAQPNPEVFEACDILGDGLWREAAIEFYAERTALVRRGKKAPKGIQPYLNRIIDSKFKEKGWVGSGGRFFKNQTWVRITFRHQMSLGSDLIDAAKVCRKEGCTQAVILAGESSWLRLVSPNDFAALVSFEKLSIAVNELDGVLDIPLLIGSLKGTSPLPAEISSKLYDRRARDITIPE